MLIVIAGDVGYHILHCNYKSKSSSLSKLLCRVCGEWEGIWNNAVDGGDAPQPCPREICNKMQYDAVPVCQVTSENEWPYFSVTFLLLFFIVIATKHSTVCAVADCYDSHSTVYFNVDSVTCFHRAYQGNNFRLK